ncbi:UDP-glucose 6-dehydrogenase YwqF [Lentibacillus kapialis]|uniref:UDP-glucose 6-dehydrogenase n=1 Tax=Lentibacillus kapialis TaxID=340214 RepID=A0A917PZY9_9BACI|nr:UDP-glucose/GDP-mannose dehydrogenase family protein [Lentibacillus kapialis]GGK01706.1 UDP-glucose 6-dehydrogenase YwqF [Lentibacillus kapialis]
MNIAVIGTGYVGLVTGVCLSHAGNSVTCVDIDKDKITGLQNGRPPIYEEGLGELLQTNLQRKRLHFTTDYQKGITGKDVILLAVGTPQNDDGSADLSALFSACRAIAPHLHEHTIIVTKSTVPIGTNEQIKHYIEQAACGMSVSIIAAPEFLRQGSAVHDTFHGDRIVIGGEDSEAMQTVEELYRPFNIPIIKTDLRSAEMIKYASNAFLAAKISFINEIANLCEHADANVEDVAQGIGMDRRIGNHFLSPGAGYGGSCFPKDLSAIMSYGRKLGCPLSILESVQNVNERQTNILVEKVQKRLGNLTGKTIAILGLAFKPGTDDMRNAPSIPLIKKLMMSGADVNAFDPAATEHAKNILPREVNYANTIDEALANADGAVIITDWQEIKDYPLESFKNHLADPVIFDGRNCFSLDRMSESGIAYYSIGRPTIHPNS